MTTVTLRADKGSELSMAEVDSNFSALNAGKEEAFNILPAAKGGTGVSDLVSLKAAMSLSNVQNTSDMNKPISTATQAALDLKADAVDIDVAMQIHDSDEKITPVANDEFGLVDSAASNVLKRFKWSSLVTALNSLYATFAQGAKADTALQPTAIGTTVLGYVSPGAVGQSLTSTGGVWASAAPTVSVGTTATTSGTAFDFTIPARAREIIPVFDGVSLSGTDDVLVQIGDSDGVETTGYVARGIVTTTTPSASINDSTVGFPIRMTNASQALHCIMSIINTSNNSWESAHCGSGSSVSVVIGGGTKTLSSGLSTVRVTRTGTNTFDSGSVTVFVRY